MGPRPADFDEGLIRQSPTFAKWLRLEPGEKLRYACRDFIRGHEQDEERLMRRIMIARRNNLRDHEILKRARKTQDPVPAGGAAAATTTAQSRASNEPPPLALPASVKEEDGSSIVVHPDNTSSSTKAVRKRRPAATFSDAQVAKEMDVVAVEATRSYKSWAVLENGAEFVYNQKYVKGKEGHDWLLRKNIWRRMRYRRENKKMVTQLREDDPSIDLVKQARPNPTSQEGKQSNNSKASGKGASDTVDNVDGKKRGVGTRTRTRSNTGAIGQRSNNKETASNKRGLGDTSGSVKSNKLPKLEVQPTLDDNLPEDMPMPDLSSSPNDAANAEDPTHAALTAAAAATASGGADDLVELSAVEAAVAAAATYVQLATQQHEVNTADDDDDDDDDDDEDEVNDDLDTASANVVHNPLEAAANAAALDSAAKLAAAATAQDAQLDEEDDDEERISVGI